jgi:hypothetical protein
MKLNYLVNENTSDNDYLIRSSFDMQESSTIKDICKKVLNKIFNAVLWINVNFINHI